MLLSIRKMFKRLITFIIILLILGILCGIIVTTFFPLGFSSHIVKYSEEYNLDPYLVAAVINVESKYDKNAISHKEARGLMQISPKTGKWAAEELEIENYSEESLFDPEINIRIGSWYLNTLLKEFNQDINLVLAAYNGGSGNVNKWLLDERYCEDGMNLKIIPFKETEKYVNKVLKNYKIYRFIYEKNLNKTNDSSPTHIRIIHNIKRMIKEAIKN